MKIKDYNNFITEKINNWSIEDLRSLVYKYKTRLLDHIFKNHKNKGYKN